MARSITVVIARRGVYFSASGEIAYSFRSEFSSSIQRLTRRQLCLWCCQIFLSPAYISLDSASLIVAGASTAFVSIFDPITVIAVTIHISPCLRKLRPLQAKKARAQSARHRFGALGLGHTCKRANDNPRIAGWFRTKRLPLSTSPVAEPDGGPGCPVVRPSSLGRGWPPARRLALRRSSFAWRFKDEPAPTAPASSSSLLAATMIRNLPE